MGSRIENYEIIKPIGKGSYGSVYLVKNKDTRKQYVMKKVNLHGMNPKERSSAQKEVTLLQRLNHPNIVTYTESFFDRRGDTLCIVMQFCEGGDLYNRLKACRGKLLREEQILEWFGQLAGSMAYIHNKRILHRDLKSQNIFLSGNTMQIGDFGIARVLDGTMAMARTIIGTPYYMSPELFENRPYNGKSDVWALGCVLYEITTLKHAFDARDMSGLAMKITRGRYPPISSQYSTSLANLIKAMLAKNPRDRPTMQQICQMPLLQGRIPGEDATPAVPRAITPSSGASGGASSDRSHRRPDYIEQQQKLRAQQQQHHQVLVANRPGSGARAGRPPVRPPVAPGRPQKPSNNLQHMMQQRARELERAKEDKQKVEGALAKLERERQLRIKEALDRQNRVAAAEKEQQKKQELNAALELNRRRQAERQRLEQQHRERMARIEKEAAEKRLREKADRDARDAAARAAVNAESERRRKAEEDRKSSIAEAEARKKREERIAAEREKLQVGMKKWENRARELEEQKRRKQMERMEEEKKKAAREAEERIAAKNLKNAGNDDDALVQLDRIRLHGRVQQEEQRRLARNAHKGLDDKKLEKLEWIADMHRENESKLKDLKARDRPSASPTPAPAPSSRPRPALRQSRDAAPSAVERNRSEPANMEGKQTPQSINRAHSDMDEKLRSQLPLPAYGDSESSQRDAVMKRKEAAAEERRAAEEAELDRARRDYVLEKREAADRLRREYHAGGLQSEPSSRRESPERDERRGHSPPERDTPRRRNRSEGGDSDEVEIEMKMQEWSEHTARIEELQEALELTRTMMENNSPADSSSSDGGDAEEEDGEGVTVDVEVDEASLSDTEGEDTDEGEGNSSRTVGNATSDSIIRSRLSDRMEVLRKHCVEGMGRDMFEKAYHFMKTTNANVLTDEQEDAAFEEFTRRFGKENQMYMQYIDQLQFLSEAYNAR